MESNVTGTGAGAEAGSEADRVSTPTEAVGSIDADRFGLELPGDLLLQLVDEAPDAVVLHDGETILYVNRRTLELIGNPPAEAVVGRPIREFLPETHQDALRARIAGMRETGERTPAEDVPLDIPGQGRYWGEFVSSPLRMGDRAIFQTVIRDATKRKGAERARAESEERFHSLFDAVPVALYRSRPDGSILEVNRSFVEMLRYPDRETLLATPARELYMDPAERRAWIEDIRADGGAELPDVRLRTYDGEEVRARLTARVKRNEGGEIDCFEGALEDVTESYQAKARFQFLFETMAQGVAFHDAEGRITVVNPAAEQILGASREELEGMSSVGDGWDTFHPDGTPMPPEERPVSVSLREGRPVRGMVMGVRSLGRHEMRWIELDAYPLFGPNGAEVEEVYSVFADITDRRRAEEELRRSEQRLERALSGSKLGLWDWNVVTGALYLDARWFEMLGYEPGSLDLDYAAWTEMVHPEDRAAVETALRRHLEGEDPYYEIELRIRTADGGWRWILDRGQVTERDPDGRPLRAAGTHTDVEERKRAEEALRRSEERTASMIRAAPLGLTLSTVDEGLFLEVNDEFAELVGYERDELIGRYSMDLGIWVSGEERAGARDGIARDGRLRGYPVRLRARDGEIRHVHLYTELLDVAGTMCALTMHQDVTEARRLEEQFRQAQKMEAVGRLAGGIAHDFNNLLTALVGHVRFLLDGLPEDDPLRADVEGIEEGAQRAERLTRQLLAFSRQQMLSPRRVDLQEVLASFEPLLRRLIGEDVLLEVGRGEPCWVRVDPAQLEQVLMNLAVNARDAMPGGGRLEIDVRCADIDEPGDPGQGDVLEPGRYAQLTVTDTGIGIDEDTLDHIFDPFYTTKPVGQGTGLGLSTVYGIISQSSGHVRVRSAPGEGTTFRIFLPMGDEGEAPQPGSVGERGQAETGGSETVLLVEDEDAVRRLAARVLERSGYTVHRAADGASAVELLSRLGAVDLLVTDVVMPGMSGRELADHVRARMPGIPVLFMSGYTADEAIRDRPPLHGGFLEKPFTPDQLMREVREALDG